MAFDYSILTNRHRRTVWLRAFRRWQRRPHQVAPLSEEWQHCASCETDYQGNFCPRCGQSAKVGRFSFKKAGLLFLDVWGLGNRGFFRTLRDLLLRPGYMIRDYLNGRQSAYFPPFKMFFILFTFFFLLSYGSKVKEAKNGVQKAGTEIVLNGNDANSNSVKVDTTKMDEVDKQAFAKVIDIIEWTKAFAQRNPAIFMLFFLTLISLPLYLFLRRNPAIPDFRYSELLVALVYMENMYLLYGYLALCLPILPLPDIIHFFAFFMLLVALHQLTGYSKRRLLLYFIPVCILSFILFIFIVVAAVVLATLFAYMIVKLQ